ncbi:MAG: hypothetical protein AAF218_00340 [Pseudomonadota bacterium]
MTQWSVSETRAMATRAARGAGIPAAQAALYAGAAVHLLQTPEGPRVLQEALQSPAATTGVLTQALCLQPGHFELPADALLCAAIRSLPGHVTIQSQDPVRAHYAPEAPPRTSFPHRLDVPRALEAFWARAAQKTYVPDSAASHAGAGAGD